MGSEQQKVQHLQHKKLTYSICNLISINYIMFVNSIDNYYNYQYEMNTK